MDNALGMMVLVSLIVAGFAQVFMAVELRRIRMALTKSLPEPVGVTSHHHPVLAGMAASPAGYAIYVYRAGRWELEADLSAPGYEPSSPTLQGAYEGQVIKKESAPAR